MKFKLNRVTFKSFIENSKKKIIKKKEPTPELVVAPPRVLVPINNTTSMVLGPDDKEAMESVLDAVHDPSILDIWRPVYYGLVGKTTIQVPERNVVISPPASVPQFVNVNANINVHVDTTVALTLGPRRMKTADLKVLRFLGEGTSGRVYMVRDTVTDMKMALKVVEKAEFNELGWKTLVKERTTLQRLEGLESVAQLHAAWHDEEFFYFAMDFYPTDLDSEMIRCRVMDPERARFYIAEMILALNEIHSHGILHRDIKAANMLISKTGHLVLADFGLSKNFKKEPTLAERVYQPYWPYLADERVEAGTPKRELDELHFVATTECGSELEMAPEIYKEEPYCFGVDFWGVGVVGFWMCTGRPPFYCDEDRPKPLRDQVIEDDLQWEATDTLSDDAKDFFEKMLTKKPEDRLRIEFDMPCHSYFAGVDWELMRLHRVPPPWIPTPATRHAYKPTTAQFVPGRVYREGEDLIPGFEYNSEMVRGSCGWCEGGDGEGAEGGDGEGEGEGEGVGEEGRVLAEDTQGVGEDEGVGEEGRVLAEAARCSPVAEMNDSDDRGRLAGGGEEEEAITDDSFLRLFASDPVEDCEDFEDEDFDDEPSQHFANESSQHFTDDPSQHFTDELSQHFANESSQHFTDDFTAPTEHSSDYSEGATLHSQGHESDVSTVFNEEGVVGNELDVLKHDDDAYAPQHENAVGNAPKYDASYAPKHEDFYAPKYDNASYAPKTLSDKAEIEAFKMMWGITIGHAPVARCPVVTPRSVFVEGIDVVVEGMDVVVEGMDVVVEGMDVVVEGKVEEKVEVVEEKVEVEVEEVEVAVPDDVAEIAPGDSSETTPGVVTEIAPGIVAENARKEYVPWLARTPRAATTIRTTTTRTTTSYISKEQLSPRQYVVPHSNVNGTGMMFKLKVWMHTIMPKTGGEQKKSLKRLTLVQ